jgi:hypothetical protein
VLRVATGDGHEVRGLEDVDVEDGEAGEVVLVDELQLELVVPRQRDECGDLERRGRAALRELLHERRPLLAHAYVEVEDVDAGGAAEVVEHRLDVGEVRKLEHHGHSEKAL